MPDADDGRIIAVLGQKIDGLKELMLMANEDTKEWRKQYSARLRKVEESTIEIRQCQLNSTRLVTGISLVLSAIAAFIGIKF